MADDDQRQSDDGLMLDPAALRAAKRAASAAGLSLEDWLSRTIVENARRTKGPGDAPPAPPKRSPPDEPKPVPEPPPRQDEPVQESFDTRLSDILIDRDAKVDEPPQAPPPKGLGPGESIAVERRRRDTGPSWLTAVLLLLLAVAAAAIWFLPRDMILGGPSPAGPRLETEPSWSTPLPPADQGTAGEPETEELAQMREAAEGGEIPAQFALGRAYLYGEGVEKNPDQAARWIFEAAKTGMPEAQFFYGVLLQHGVGVRQDAQEAVMWFQRAANAGHAKAQFNTGVAYFEGEAIPQNYERAKTYFERAARQGLPEAQYNLGTLYEHGLGTEPDKAVAFKWYSLAFASGHAEAGQALDALIPRMSDEQIRRAGNLIEEERGGG